MPDISEIWGAANSSFCTLVVLKLFLNNAYNVCDCVLEIFSSLSNANLKFINDEFHNDYIYGNRCPNRRVDQKRVDDRKFLSRMSMYAN